MYLLVCMFLLFSTWTGLWRGSVEPQSHVMKGMWLREWWYFGKESIGECYWSSPIPQPLPVVVGLRIRVGALEGMESICWTRATERCFSAISSLKKSQAVVRSTSKSRNIKPRSYRVSNDHGTQIAKLRCRTRGPGSERKKPPECQ